MTIARKTLALGATLGAAAALWAAPAHASTTGTAAGTAAQNSAVTARAWPCLPHQRWIPELQKCFPEW
ncbi:hypothetical protein ACIBF1_21625 [Spirillospora sp. NPDC050679]